MAWQSSLEQVRSIRLGRNTVIGLVGGILVGLLLGLLIGWVWWPVEWQGPEPAAAPAASGSQFEAPEAKALYLGAVADAFVYSAAAGEADAGPVAGQRLAALGGDIRTAFNNAIDFYSAQAGSATRVNNLALLASALGIPLAAAATAPADAGSAPAGSEAAQPAAAQSAAPAATNVAATEGGSTNWLLALFMALLLIGGGVYILLMLRRSAAQGNSAPFDEEELAPAATPSVTAFDRSTLSPVRSGLTPAASIRSTVERPHPSQAGGPHGFEADEPDEFDDPDYLDDEQAEEQNAQVRFHRTPVQDDDAYNVAADDEDMDGWRDEDGETEQPDRHAAPPPGYVTSVGATPPYSGMRSSGAADQRQPPPADPPGDAPAQSAAPRTPPPATLQPPTPSRFAQYTPIGNYTAEYYMGRSDFDQAKNILADGNYIGEYGIIIPPGQGVLNNDPEKSIAMDVYLFDKSDERQPLTVKRWLLSTYADDHKRAEFERDKQSKPPIVAQPNTNFQLEGVQLLLDCSIRQVAYTPEGYFQTMTVDLVLKRKS